MGIFVNLFSRLRTLPLPKQLALYAPIIATVLLLVALVHTQIFRGNIVKTLWLVGFILLLGLIFAGLWYLRHRSEARKAQKFDNDVVDASKNPLTASVEARQAEERFAERLREHIAILRKRGVNLYDIPWFVLIGESGSGKTVMMRNSGLSFDQRYQEKAQGTGGTLHVDWWLATEGVVLDTAGRMVVKDADAGDPERWDRFLKSLLRMRPHCPVNGVILVVPSESLLKDDIRQREEKAQQLRERLLEIQSILEVQFPVWLVITKSDRIVGFAEFASQFSVEQQRQIFGWSYEGAFDEPWDTSEFDNVFDGLLGRIRKWQLRFLGRTVIRTREASMLNQFVHEFERLRGPLGQYLRDLLLTPVFRDPLFFRGFYFTSGTQEGEPIPAGAESRLAGSQILENLKELFGEGLAYFIREFFLSKVFPEQGLVVRPKWAESKNRRTKRIAYIASAAIVGLTCFTVFWGYWQWQKSGFHEIVMGGAGESDILNYLGNEPGFSKDLERAGILTEKTEQARKWQYSRWQTFSGVGTAAHVKGLERYQATFVRERILKPLLSDAWITSASKLEQGEAPDGNLLRAYLQCYNAAAKASPPPQSATLTALLSLPKPGLDDEKNKTIVAKAIDKAAQFTDEDEELVWNYVRDEKQWAVFPPLQQIQNNLVDNASKTVGQDLATAESWWAILNASAAATHQVLMTAPPGLDGERLPEIDQAYMPAAEHLNALRVYVDAYKPGVHSKGHLLELTDDLYGQWVKAVEGPLQEKLETAKRKREDEMQERFGAINAGFGEYQYFLQVQSGSPPVMADAALQLIAWSDGLHNEFNTLGKVCTEWRSDEGIGADKSSRAVADVLSEFAEKPTTQLPSLVDPGSGVEVPPQWQDWADGIDHVKQRLGGLRELSAVNCFWRYSLLEWLKARTSGDTTATSSVREDNFIGAMDTLSEFSQWLKDHTDETSGDPVVKKELNAISNEVDVERVRLAQQYHDSWSVEVNQAKAALRTACQRAARLTTPGDILKALRDLPVPDWDPLPADAKEDWLPKQTFVDGTEIIRDGPRGLLTRMIATKNEAECLRNLKGMFSSNRVTSEDPRLPDYPVTGCDDCYASIELPSAYKSYREAYVHERLPTPTPTVTPLPTVTPTPAEPEIYKQIVSPYEKKRPSAGGEKDAWMTCKDFDDVLEKLKPMPRTIFSDEAKSFLDEWQRILCSTNAEWRVKYPHGEPACAYIVYHQEPAINMNILGDDWIAVDGTEEKVQDVDLTDGALASSRWGVILGHQYLSAEELNSGGDVAFFAESAGFGGFIWELVAQEGTLNIGWSVEEYGSGWRIRNDSKNAAVEIEFRADGRTVQPSQLEPIDWFKAIRADQ